MRILQISTYYPPNFGGIEMVAYDLSRILKKNGNEVHVVCFNSCNVTVNELYEGIGVTRIGYNLKLFSQAVSLRYYAELKHVTREFAPDVIHIHLPNPLIAAYLLAIAPKCKITVHWHSDIIRQRILKKVVKPIENRILTQSKGIIATSQIYADKSKSLAPYMGKITAIPNIVNTEFLSSINEDEQRRIKELKAKYKGKTVVFFCGVHREYKGLKYLIEAAKFLPSTYVVIIAGDGPLTPELKQRCVEMAISNVEFIGRISDSEKKCWLHSADIFAFPSITKNEAFGIALAEAMYCGLPAATFHIEGSGVNFVNLDKITGIEVPCIDSTLYAKALEDLVANKSEYGKAAHSRICQLFTEKAITARLLDFFAKV